MLNNRYIRHGLFWVVYFGVNLYNELFMSSSFTENPSLNFIMLAVTSQLLTLTVKVPLVYVVIYHLIPKWLIARNRKRVVAEGILILLLATVMHRLIIQKIIWPYIYANPEIHLTMLQQTARLFYSLLDLLQVTGIAAAIRLFRMRISAVKKEKALVQEKLQAEMLHLKAQINPHFLFNSLNSIFALTRSRSDKAPDAVMMLSNILRHMIYETDGKTTTLGNEVRIIGEYIQLQKIRFGDRIEVSFQTEIENESAQIAPLLCLPLVENAFKHGITGKTVPAPIRIRVVQSGVMFSLEVENAHSAEKHASSGETGIGIANIKRQLELQYRDFGFETGVRNGHFIVNLRLKLDTYEGPELFDRGG